MKNLKINLVIICLFLPSIVKSSNEEDSSNASVQLSVRYVLETKESKNKKGSISFGEAGNIPASMNMQLDVQPFLWSRSKAKNLFFIFDSKFGQDRTSSEFGLGFKQKDIEVYISYGFRAIRKDDEGLPRGLSSSYQNQTTKTFGIYFDFRKINIESSIVASISYDGNNAWFYKTRLQIFPFGDYSPIYTCFFHESYFGSGASLVYRNRNESTDLFFGYLFPENKFEKFYKRTEGFMFSLTHTWK